MKEIRLIFWILCAVCAAFACFALVDIFKIINSAIGMPTFQTFADLKDAQRAEIGWASILLLIAAAASMIFFNYWKRLEPKTE